MTFTVTTCFSDERDPLRATFPPVTCRFAMEDGHPEAEVCSFYKDQIGHGFIDLLMKLHGKVGKEDVRRMALISAQQTCMKYGGMFVILMPDNIQGIYFRRKDVEEDSKDVFHDPTVDSDYGE